MFQKIMDLVLEGRALYRKAARLYYIFHYYTIHVYYNACLLYHKHEEGKMELIRKRRYDILIEEVDPTPEIYERFVKSIRVTSRKHKT